jgi:FkbM family methyltransferase
MSLKLHRRIAGLFGYELIKRRKLNDTLEQHLGNLLSLLKINCVFDVGANAGPYGTMLRAMGYAGRIVSFEPLAGAFEELKRTSEGDSDWRIRRLALGRESGFATINHCKSNAFSSLRDPNEYGQRRFKWQMEVTEQEPIVVSTLPEVWDGSVEGIAEPRVFLKLDTQGYDLEVLLAADDVIHSVYGVQTELALQPIYQDMPDYIDALTAFRDRGFEITGFYPVTRDKHSLAVIEYDCFMERTLAISQNSTEGKKAPAGSW